MTVLSPEDRQRIERMMSAALESAGEWERNSRLAADFREDAACLRRLLAAVDALQSDVQRHAINAGSWRRCADGLQAENAKLREDLAAANLWRALKQAIPLNKQPDAMPKTGPNAVLDQTDADLYHVAEELRRVKAERKEQSDRLLRIAGLVNRYHNDLTYLTAAETLSEVAAALGPPWPAPVQEDQ